MGNLVMLGVSIARSTAVLRLDSKSRRDLAEPDPHWAQGYDTPSGPSLAQPGGGVSREGGCRLRPPRPTLRPAGGPPAPRTDHIHYDDDGHRGSRPAAAPDPEP